MGNDLPAGIEAAVDWRVTEAGREELEDSLSGGQDKGVADNDNDDGVETKGRVAEGTDEGGTSVGGVAVSIEGLARPLQQVTPPSKTWKTFRLWKFWKRG